MYFDKSYYNENNCISSVDLICDKCGNYINVDIKSGISKATNEYCVVEENNNISCSCGNICQHGIIEPKKLQQINYTNTQIDLNKPKCPTCNSMNVEKISMTKKVIGGAMLGLLSSDVRKSMHCKNCGYKW